MFAHISAPPSNRVIAQEYEKKSHDGACIMIQNFSYHNVLHFRQSKEAFVDFRHSNTLTDSDPRQLDDILKTITQESRCGEICIVFPCLKAFLAVI
jgi:hypothetical protein